MATFDPTVLKAIAIQRLRNGLFIRQNGRNEPKQTRIQPNETALYVSLSQRAGSFVPIAQLEARMSQVAPDQELTLSKRVAEGLASRLHLIEAPLHIQPLFGPNKILTHLRLVSTTVPGHSQDWIAASPVALGFRTQAGEVTTTIDPYLLMRENLVRGRQLSWSELDDEQFGRVTSMKWRARILKEARRIVVKLGVAQGYEGGPQGPHVVGWLVDRDYTITSQTTPDAADVPEMLPLARSRTAVGAKSPFEIALQILLENIEHFIPKTELVERAWGLGITQQSCSFRLRLLENRSSDALAASFQHLQLRHGRIRAVKTPNLFIETGVSCSGRSLELSGPSVTSAPLSIEAYLLLREFTHSRTGQSTKEIGDAAGLPSIRGARFGILRNLCDEIDDRLEDAGSSRRTSYVGERWRLSPPEMSLVLDITH